ncbi:MAG: glycoside hydrolase family 2 TIM barrel-domain containing protein, partial [Candidatus Dormibacterales bacterium]
ATNALAVRVDLPPPGTRLDIVPWGLADWWEYGGITGPVWLEAGDQLSVVRAQVVPHLDAADVTVVVRNHSSQPVQNGTLEADILPAQVTAADLLNPDPTSLVPPGSTPIARETITSIGLSPGAVASYEFTFVLSGAYPWTPALPALYVLRIRLGGSTPAPLSSPGLSPSPASASPAAASPAAALSPGAITAPASPALVSHQDTFYTTYGLRTIQVDPSHPRLLLNGAPTSFVGVSVQDERVWPPRPGPDSVRGGPHPSPADWERVLEQARAVHADLLRTGHTPASPQLLMLADRMGFAIWEEIPLTHNTPQTLTLAMGRGIPQQMLAEMDLRDFNHPSVLFHGFANESTGGPIRTQAMKTLNDLDHRVDGTRLTGQAMYGSDPSDPTSGPLDVAGYTFYYGVFYGGAGIEGATLKALAAGHATYPRKPIMILEFGRWADNPAEAQLQEVVFRRTYRALHARWGTRPHGYVGAALWWTLNDYWTALPGMGVEHFGVYRPDGTQRPVAAPMASNYLHVAETSGAGVQQSIVSGGRGAAPHPPS